MDKMDKGRQEEFMITVNLILNAEKSEFLRILIYFKLLKFQ